MSNAETARHIRAWCAESSHHTFSWPTDGCGYEQHIRFVEHRNAKLKSGMDFREFALAYADTLEERR